MPNLRRVLATCLAGALAFAACPASASPILDLTTTVGDATIRTSGGEYLVRVTNPDLVDADGTLELVQPWRSATVARAPYHVPARSTAFYRMPIAIDTYSDRIQVVARAGGFEVAKADERRENDASLLLFDIPPRDDQRLEPLRTHEGVSRKQNAHAAFSHAAYDPRSNVPVLTERPAAYDGIALTLVPSNVFLRLAPRERAALVDWVRTGGVLGIAVSDPADLAHPELTALVGTGVQATPATETPSTGTPEEPGPAVPKTLALDAFEGGRVHSTGIGAHADVGLGVVHLLPVDPWSPQANGDAWVQDWLVTLASRTPAKRPYRFGRPAQDVMRVLDPNEGYRSGMVIGGLLLVGWAVVAGLGFRRLAMRRGMGPAYRFVAAGSVVTFGAVIAAGVHAKGGPRARAREIAFAEAASGENIAWVSRYRGYFASTARTFDVVPRDPADLLAPVSTNEKRVLMEPDRLTGVPVLPWRTTTVAEKGTIALEGGVTLGYEGTELFVHNATHRTLRSVLVATKVGQCLSFPTIAAGERVTVARAKTSIACSDPSRLGPAWNAWVAANREEVSSSESLFPEFRLALVAELDEPDVPATDGGFRLESHMTFLRVLGGAS